MTDRNSADGRRNSWELELDKLDNMDRRTRFQVNRVDTTNADEDEMQKLTSNPDQDDQPDAADMSTGYDTKYAKSFRHFTREALPRLDNYRNIMSIQAAYRPTLDELHNATVHGKPAHTQLNMPQNEGEGVIKFGWIQGVLVRCLLNIWGVMLFLRLSWVVGQAGIGEAMLLIMATTLVTTITAISMAAISTNGEIKGGGTYYMISRSLGPEFGGSIGLIFSLANAVACSMYVVGFCESLTDLLRSYDLSIFDGGIQDVRIIGSITIVILTVIVVVGMEWEAKAQNVLLVILLIAMLDFLFGCFYGPLDDEERAKGFVGLSFETLSKNFFSAYREQDGESHSFFSVFSIFFPAATGILAGANISGDLADPQTAIPKGTLIAILITSASYLGFAALAGGSVERDAMGNVTAYEMGVNITDCPETGCEWGLMNNKQVMELVSLFGPLIYAGCFAATLSSALASLVSAPKVFQALCKDNLYPYISGFAKGYGKNNEPVRGYVLTFVIAVVFILIGELNTIAPLISNFFLAAYALINFSTFHASLAKPVGWRPTFRFYNMWLSLIGSVLCVSVMFLISWATALLTLLCVLALYLIVTYRKPDVNWGSTTQAQTYNNALMSVQQLSNVEDHVKNYRPQILVLSGMPSSRPPLVDFAWLISKNLSLMICGHILKGPVPQRARHALGSNAQDWLRKHHIKGFYSMIEDSSFENGAKSLMQASGVGKLKPNILLMGYQTNWLKCTPDELNMYFDTMHKALDMHLAVALLRVQGGLDYSALLSPSEEMRNGKVDKAAQPVPHSNSADSLTRNQSFSQMSQELAKYLGVGFLQIPRAASTTSDITPPRSPNTSQSRNSNSPVGPSGDVENGTPNAAEEVPEEKGGALTVPQEKTDKEKDSSRVNLYKGADGIELPKEHINNLTQFTRKQKKGTIDVWWLYDDGGLTLLLPYIISTRRNWSACKLRVFALANKKDELDTEQRSMASLLSKFRIDYSDLKIIPNITKKPQESTKKLFDEFIKDFTKDKDGVEDSAPISESELLAMKDKTNRHLRLRELLLENSNEANLVVMTLPMPRKGVVSAPLYMAWLETLTRDMPPFLLVRGNQTSVLTFYS
ncbi:bumetanide-sensitive sodium-(potassium)-chloride cotransporter isoform X1 [Cloeon dipterum]|uniref:bumetanide-sensitive sodium-(potassium)-chloride cotransporter isoform X1 n=1 Tax=Cloeon dipterum TaxID=197152 RepID=UPI0032205C5B